MCANAFLRFYYFKKLKILQQFRYSYNFHFSCRDSKNSASLCHKNANCYFIKETNGHECRCKDGYQIDGYKNDDLKNPLCIDNCMDKKTKTDYCKNQGTCLKVRLMNCFIAPFYTKLTIFLYEEYTNTEIFFFVHCRTGEIMEQPSADALAHLLVSVARKRVNLHILQEESLEQ